MTTFRNNEKKVCFSYKTGVVFVHGEVFKGEFRSSAMFKMELFAIIGNGSKLQRASSNMRHGSWIGSVNFRAFLLPEKRKKKS